MRGSCQTTTEDLEGLVRVVLTRALLENDGSGRGVEAGQTMTGDSAGGGRTRGQGQDRDLHLESQEGIEVHRHIRKRTNDVS